MCVCDQFKIKIQGKSTFNPLEARTKWRGFPPGRETGRDC